MTMNRTGKVNWKLYRIGAIFYGAGRLLRMRPLIRSGIRIKDHAWKWRHVD